MIKKIVPLMLTTLLPALLFAVSGYGFSMSGTSDPSSGTESHPYDDIPGSATFDVVTWNIEWFGHETRGPSDTELQYNNVVQIIDSLQPDLIGVQEIYSSEQFERLINDLDNYDGFITDYTSQSLNVGFIYQTETITPGENRLIDGYGLKPYDWAYRLPLEYLFQVRIEGTTYSMHAVVIHAKAMGDQSSYERRVAASRQIKNGYFDEHLLQVPLIFLGDYNDYVTGSTAGADLSSPYQNFVDDSYYEVVTLPLEEAGEASWPGIGSKYDASMLDHITINRFLAEDWMHGSEQIHRPDYIENYTGTTSDHYPVVVRFDITGEATATNAGMENMTGTDAEQPETTMLLPNYPNPFNPETIVPFRLAEPSTVTITIYNTFGQQVARLVHADPFPAGEHTVRFDAENLSSGVYLYEMQLDDGTRITRTMQFIK